MKASVAFNSLNHPPYSLNQFFIFPQRPCALSSLEFIGLIKLKDFTSWWVYYDVGHFLLLLLFFLLLLLFHRRCQSHYSLVLAIFSTNLVDRLALKKFHASFVTSFSVAEPYRWTCRAIRPVFLGFFRSLLGISTTLSRVEAPSFLAVISACSSDLFVFIPQYPSLSSRKLLLSSSKAPYLASSIASLSPFASRLLQCRQLFTNFPLKDICVKYFERKSSLYCEMAFKLANG